MSKFNLLLVLMTIMTGCAQDQDDDLKGIWQFSRPTNSENDLNINFEGQDGTSKSEKIIKKYNEEGIEHFYLEFGGDGELIEYKVGLGVKFNYRVSNDTIFKDEKAYYRILKLTSDTLTLKYFYSEIPTVYKRVEVDLSDHEMAN